MSCSRREGEPPWREKGETVSHVVLLAVFSCPCTSLPAAAMRGDLIAALLSLGLAALAVSTAGGGRPGSKASGATRLGDPTGGGGVGAGPLPPRAPEQTGTAAGGLPQAPTQHRARQGGQSGPMATEAAATGGSQTSGQPSHHRVQQPQTQSQYQRPRSSQPPLQPPQPVQPTAQQSPQWQPQVQAAVSSTWPAATTSPHTAHAGTQQQQPRPTAGHHQMSPQLTAQVNDQPHAAATVWEALVPPSQLRPLPHSTATQSAQQPEPHQPAGPQMPHQEPPQSLAAVHSKPTALYPAQPTRVR